MSAVIIVLISTCLQICEWRNKVDKYEWYSGFPTGVENIGGGGSSKFDGGS